MKQSNSNPPSQFTIKVALINTPSKSPTTDNSHVHVVIFVFITFCNDFHRKLTTDISTFGKVVKSLDNIANSIALPSPGQRSATFLRTIPFETNYRVLGGTTPCQTKLSRALTTAIVSPEKPKVKSVQERSFPTAYPPIVMLLSSWRPLYHLLMENLLSQVRNGRPKIRKHSPRKKSAKRELTHMISWTWMMFRLIFSN